MLFYRWRGSLSTTLADVNTSILIIIVSSASTLTLTPILIRLLTKRGLVVPDHHKPSKPMVPKPGGPAIVASLIFGEAVLYYATGDIRVLALVSTVAITSIIGLIDDLHTLGGAVKPTLLVISSLPIILLGAYSFRPEFPIFGHVRLPIIYPLLVLAAIPVTANTVNTIDVLNGAVSGFTAIASIPLILALALKGDYVMLQASLPLLFSSLSFYIYHRYPSKIFPGDSGSLSIGAFYGALTITGGVEIVGITALLPAILNSFFFLSSVKRLVEHREIKERPVRILEDRRLAASRSEAAPMTLVRLILADGPLSEKEVVKHIFALSAFSTILASITAILTWGV